MTADLTAAAIAAGNSDQISATAPVTNGVATLVPPIVAGSVVAPTGLDETEDHARRIGNLGNVGLIRTGSIWRIFNALAMLT